LIVSAVDIGSNTVRLLTVDDSGREIRREVTVTGLAGGVDATGVLSDGAVEATIDVLASYAEWIVTDGSQRTGAVATSACRDAANGPTVIEGFGEVIGVTPQIISGRREARLAFRGATAHAGAGDHVVVDVGGGSTEIIEGTRTVRWGHSYDIGSVRLTDRCLANQPVKPEDIAEARDVVTAVFLDPVPKTSSTAVIGVAGTFTSIAAMVLGLARYDREQVDGAVLTAHDLTVTVDRLTWLTLDEIAAIPSLDPKRAPVILGGAIVAERVIAAVGVDTLTVSEHDLLDGLAAELIEPT
jgi:exopolyphosphatase/guanosine-5'-triphosphate,3'-diphosphate pyrophosphatase